MKKIYLRGSLGIMVLALLVSSCDDKYGSEYRSDAVQASGTQTSESQTSESQTSESQTSESQTSESQTQQREQGQTGSELGSQKSRELVRKAREKLSELPGDVAIKFPLGSNSPMGLGEAAANQKKWEAVGYFARTEERVELLKPAELIQVLDMHLDSLNGGNSAMTQSAEGNVEANNGDQQTGNIAVIDLIAHDRETGKFYLLPNVRLRAFVKDAINGTLNEQVSTHELDLNSLNLRRTRPGDERIYEL